MQELVTIFLDASSVQKHMARSGFVEVLNEVDAGTLAAATRTHQGYHLPRGHRETHVLWKQ